MRAVLPSTKVRAYEPRQVLSTDGQTEVDPREAGLRGRDVDAIWNSVVRLYQTRLHPAVALCLRRRGVVVLDRALGHRTGNSPDDRGAALEPATPGTYFNLFSASKMVTAMLIHLLDERGQVHLDDPIAHYIPEFGRHGKEWITLRHVLTHRAGIPTLPREYYALDLIAEPERVLDILCDLKPTLPPGRRLAYHALTGGFVLAAVIERVTGVTVRELLQREVATTLGMEQFNYGVSADQIDRVAMNARTGPPAPPPISTLFKRALGVSFADAAALSNDTRFLTGVVPAGNLITTANDACRFMQLLLNGGELDGVRIFDSRTIQRAVAEQSYLEVDLILGFPTRYGMGFMLGSNYVCVFGRKSPRAFGHVGFTNVVMWADPERDISACLMTSGKPFIAPGQLRWLGLMQTIATRCPRDWGR